MNNGRAEILLAEDSKLQSEVLQGILVENGYTVYAVENGLEGLYKLLEVRPDLIISDVWMPKMTGYEFCSTIKQDNSLRSIPVILLTSLSDTKDVTQGLEAGADYYLTKPYDEKLLLLTIKSILSNTKERREGEGKGAAVEIRTEGETRTITAEPQKIMNFLLSTYQNMLYQNRHLEETRFELRRLNNSLEERVREKTRVLEEEIWERKKTQEALVQSEEKFRGIFENTTEGIFQVSPDGSFVSVNPACARMFGFPSPEDMRRVAADASFGHYVGEDTYARFSETMAEQGSIRGFETSAQRIGGGEIWLAVNARAVRDGNGGVLFYEGSLEDITDRKSAHAELRDSLANLKKTLDGTVLALATTIEMRDPYTAGHQRRVARLACAIAREVGFSDHKLEGMQVIGFLHDIGKIVVPAEILSKPGALNDLEFNMIKAHSEVGYNILKGIDFPWPVSLAVLQHHERLDGSGYPSGLKGEDIIPEARILAVADVVESMASHRPYRPALGVASALNEVCYRRGIYYDSLVVDATVRLLNEDASILE